MRAHPAGGTTMVARLRGGHWKTATTSPMTTRWDYAVSPIGRMTGATAWSTVAKARAPGSGAVRRHNSCAHAVSAIHAS